MGGADLAARPLVAAGLGDPAAGLVRDDEDLAVRARVRLVRELDHLAVGTLLGGRGVRDRRLDRRRAVEDVGHVEDPRRVEPGAVERVAVARERDVVRVVGDRLRDRPDERRGRGADVDDLEPVEGGVDGEVRAARVDRRRVRARRAQARQVAVDELRLGTSPSRGRRRAGRCRRLPSSVPRSRFPSSAGTATLRRLDAERVEAEHEHVTADLDVVLVARVGVAARRDRMRRVGDVEDARAAAHRPDEGVVVHLPVRRLARLELDVGADEAADVRDVGDVLRRPRYEAG